MNDSDDVVFKVSDSPMLEMPNGKFRDSFMVTDRTGTGKGLSAGIVWFTPENVEGHPDTHEFDEVFYVIKGRAIFRGDGRDHVVTAGDVVYCPAGMEHTYITGKSPLQIFWCITNGWEKMDRALIDEINTTWRKVDPTSGWQTEI
jgi:mannose-6-phosphate isomerase-like protein (cupin superfamily)